MNVSLRSIRDIQKIWRGKELLADPDWMVEFTAADIDEIQTALGQNRNCAVEAISKQSFVLPSFAGRLAEIQTSLEHGCGATMVRGFPIDQFSDEDIARIFWGLTQQIGTPISQSAKGERIFHVRDAGFAANDPKARGPNTKKRLSFHTDRCDVIAFLCMRQAKSGGENFVVSSPALYEEIREQRPELLEQLLQPYFYKRHTIDTGNSLPYLRQPIFSIFKERFAANMLRVLIERAYQMPELPDMTPQQREALDFVEELAEDPSLHVQFRQEPGDILFLNNWVTLHRRSEFVDHAEPELRRHLLRIWLSVPNSRPLDPLFRENYGSTEAGAIRGGIHPSNA